MSNGKTGKRGYQMPGPKLHTSRAHSTHVTPPITPKVLTGGGATHPSTKGKILTGGFTKPNGGGMVNYLKQRKQGKNIILKRKDISLNKKIGKHPKPSY